MLHCVIVCSVKYELQPSQSQETLRWNNQREYHGLVQNTSCLL